MIKLGLEYEAESFTGEPIIYKFVEEKEEYYIVEWYFKKDGVDYLENDRWRREAANEYYKQGKMKLVIPEHEAEISKNYKI